MAAVDYKVIVVGDTGVGKTSVIHRFYQIESTDTTEPPTRFKFNGPLNTRVVLDLWDSDGEGRCICPFYYRGAHAVIFVYDVSSRPTFEHLTEWSTAVGRYCHPRVKYLVGNKNDLVRQVSLKDAEKFARSNNFDYFLESGINTRRDPVTAHLFLGIADRLCEDFEKIVTDRFAHQLNKLHLVQDTADTTSAVEQKCICWGLIVDSAVVRGNCHYTSCRFSIKQ